MDCCEEWNNKVSRCPKAAEGFEPYHKWIVSESDITSWSNRARILTCGVCFHEVDISDVSKYRDCVKAL